MKCYPWGRSPERNSQQARMRNALQILLTRAFPSFGGELVIVARKRLNAAAAAPGSQ